MANARRPTRLGIMAKSVLRDENSKLRRSVIRSYIACGSGDPSARGKNAGLRDDALEFNSATTYKFERSGIRRFGVVPSRAI
jgi:hypothetical protein